MGLGDDGADVDEAQGRVGGRLDPDELGLRGDVRRDVDLDLGGEGDFHAVGLCDLGEVAVGAAVDVRDGDDVGAGGEGLEDDSGGRGAGGEGEGVLCVLEGGDGLLEVVAVGVAGARVLVDADGLAHARLREGRREGDGLDDGAGDGVMRRPGVDGEGAEVVDGRGRPRRGLDGVLGGDGHDCGRRSVCR